MHPPDYEKKFQSERGHFTRPTNTSDLKEAAPDILQIDSENNRVSDKTIGTMKPHFHEGRIDVLWVGYVA